MKRTLKILAVIAVLLIAALAVVVLTFDINQYKPDIISAVKENTGRDFRIDGDIRLGVSLVPTVVIEKAALGNAGWGTRESMLKVEKLELAVAVLPLLSGDIQIDRLHLVRPDIYLETDADGRSNWVMNPGQEKPETPAPEQTAAEEGFTPSGLHFRQIFIEKAVIAFRDGGTEETHEVSVAGIKLRAGGKDEPMEVNLDAEYRDRTLRISGTTGSLKALLANTPFTVNLEAGIGKLRVDIEGTAARPLEGNGLDLRIALETDSLADLSSGGGLPKAGPVSLNAALKRQDGKYTLESLDAKLGKSDLAGRAVVDTSTTVPEITVELQSQQLDVTPFEPEKKNYQQPPADHLFPSDPLPLEYLNKANVQLSLAVGSFRSRHLPLNNVRAQLRLQGGSLRIAPLTARYAGGKLVGEAALTNTGRDTANLNLKLDIDDLVPAKLPQMTGKNYIRNAKTDIDLGANSTGGSVRAIMGSLNGNLLIKAGPGEIRNTSMEMAGADLLSKMFSMITPSSEKDEVTPLLCAVVNFDIKDGMAVSDGGIAMETERMNVVGGGTINLRSEEIDLGMRPYPRSGVGVSAGSFAELVRLGGTLAKPEAKPSTVAAMRTAATVGAAVATGGISLVAGLIYNRATADPEPCMTALGGKTDAAATAKPAAEPEKKSIGDKVKGMFQGIFGD